MKEGKKTKTTQKGLRKVYLWTRPRDPIVTIFGKDFLTPNRDPSCAIFNSIGPVVLVSQVAKIIFPFSIGEAKCAMTDRRSNELITIIIKTF